MSGVSDNMALLEYSDKARIELPQKADPPSKVASILLWVAVAISVACSFWYGYSLNSEVGLATTAFALVPLAALVAISLLLVPRSEVSLPLRFLALLWGAVGSTNLTLLVVGRIENAVGPLSLNMQVVVQAPVVEELAKGIFVFALFFFFRSLIRTPLGGAGIGLLLGAGFAFVENIMYFNNSYNSGGWPLLWETVILRAGMSFFLHALATMCIGLFIGYAARNRNRFSWWRRVSFINMGLVSAMVVHGLWNGMASLTTINAKWNVLYLCFWIPFVLVVTVALFMLRRNYWDDRKKVILGMVKEGYVRMYQAEQIVDGVQRKALYKHKPSAELIRWESSILRIYHWDEIIKSSRLKFIRSLAEKGKTKDTRRLMSVLQTVG